MGFHNTIKADGQTLLDLNEKSLSGDSAIIELFKAGDMICMTPWEVHAKLKIFGYKYEITSVRRSITTLTKKGILEKLDKENQKDECKGVANNRWKLKIV